MVYNKLTESLVCMFAIFQGRINALSNCSKSTEGTKYANESQVESKR